MVQKVRVSKKRLSGLLRRHQQTTIADKLGLSRMQVYNLRRAYRLSRLGEEESRKNG